MALTANRLRAVVTADTAEGVKKLREFSEEFSRTRDAAQRESSSIADIFKGGFGAIALAGVIGGIGRGLVGVFSTVSQGMRGVLSDAFTAVKEYQMLEMGLRQLTATQIMGAGFTDDMTTALEMAAVPAQNLIKWIEELAIKSPFNMSQVASALRMAEAFGFTEGQAKRLTQAMTDFSAGTGMGGDVINRMMLNLGQMAAAGKITGREIRDLAMAGLPVKNILADAFGVTTAAMTDMLEEGTVPLGEGLEAITVYLETNFKGAAERTTDTWQGLMSSLEDIKSIDLRLLFGGMYESFRPEVAKIVDFLGSEDFKTRLVGIGMAIGDSVKSGVQVAKKALGEMFQGSEIADIAKLMASGDYAGAIASIVDQMVSLGLTITSKAMIVVESVAAVGELFAGVLSSIAVKIGEFKTSVVWEILSGQTPTPSPDDGLQGVRDVIDNIRWALEPEYMKERASKSGAAGAGGGGTDFGQDATFLTAFSDKIAGILAEADIRDAKIADTLREARISSAAIGGRAENTGGTNLYDEILAAIQQKLDDNTFTNLTDKDAVAKEEANRKLVAAVEKATSLVSGKLDKGIEVSRSLGTVPGLDKFAAGANGPFEALYRIQDVALNWNKPGVDTAKWAEMYGVDQTSAMSIIRDFQSGNFTDQVTKFIDVPALKSIMAGEADARASQKRFAESIGADPAFMAKLMGEDPLTVPAANINSAAAKLSASADTLNAAAATMASPSLPPEGAGNIAEELPKVFRNYLGPVNWNVEPGISIIAGAPAEIQQNFPGIKAGVSDTADFTKLDASVSEWVKKAYNSVRDFLGGIVFKPVTEWVTKAYNNARDWLEKIVFKPVIEWVTKAYNSAKDWLNTIIFKPVTEWVTGVWNRATEWLGTFVFKPVSEWVTKAYNNASNWLNTIVFKPVSEWVTGVWTRTVSWLNTIVFTPISLWVTATWNRAVVWLNEIVFTPVSTWVTSAWTRATTWLNTIVFEPVTTWVTDAWTRVTDWLGGIKFADISTSLGSAWTRVTAWIDGISLADISTSLSSAWTRVTDWLAGISLADISIDLTGVVDRVSAWLGGILFDAETPENWVSAAASRVSDWLGGIDFSDYGVAGLVGGVVDRVRAFLDGINFTGSGGGGASGAGGPELAYGGGFSPLSADTLRALQSQGSGGGGNRFGNSSQYLPTLLQGGDMGAEGKSWLPTLLGGGSGAVLSEADSLTLAHSLKEGVLSGVAVAGAEQPSVMSQLVASGGGKVDVSAWLPTFLSSIDSGLQGEKGKELEDRGGNAWGVFEKGFVAKARNSAALNSAIEAMVESAISKILGD